MKPVFDLTVDEAVTELEQVCDQLLDLPRPSKKYDAINARKLELQAWVLMKQGHPPAPAPPETPTQEPDPMPKPSQTDEEKRAKAREYNRKWAAKKRAEQGGAKPAKAIEHVQDHVQEKPKQIAPPAPVSPTYAKEIAEVRRQVWLLMASLETLAPEKRAALTADLALLDAAAHAAHQLALGRLEVA